jgi:hypothetical protein
MSETISTPKWSFSIVSGTAVILLMTSGTPIIPSFENWSPMLVQNSIRTIPTTSKSLNLPGEAKNWEEMRAMKIKALRGKYRNVLTPTEEFSEAKQQEIELEEQL